MGGSNSEKCDGTGQCDCKVGFKGTQCNECDTGFSGEKCDACEEGFFNYPTCQGQFEVLYTFMIPCSHFCSF